MKYLTESTEFTKNVDSVNSFLSDLSVLREKTFLYTNTKIGEYYE
jgi:phage/plasmid-associated DNA primase